MMENVRKRVMKDPLMILRIGLGAVFLLAGLHRLIFFGMAKANFIDVGIVPATFLVSLAIIVELVAGILLILNREVDKACAMILILLAIGIGASIVRAGSSLLSNINEVFLLTYTPTNIVMHAAYFVGVLTILFWALGKKRK